MDELLFGHPGFVRCAAVFTFTADKVGHGQALATLGRSVLLRTEGEAFLEMGRIV